MKISCLPHGCLGEGGLELVEWFRKASEWGLDGVEVMDRWVMEGLMGPTNHGLMESIEGELDRLGLEVSAVINHGPYVWESDEPNSLEMRKARFFLRWACRLDADILRVTTGVREASEIADVRARSVFGGYIRELLPLARDRGIRIALEEHPGFAGTVKKLGPILRDIPDPNFGLAFDTKNTMREGEDPLVILDREDVLDRVIYTHIDNYFPGNRGWNRSVTLDQGWVDIAALVEGLHGHGYDGWLSVEYGGNDLEQVHYSIEWLRSIWQDLEG